MRSCAEDYSKIEAKTRLGPRGMRDVWQQQWLKTSQSPGELVWERKYEWSEKSRNIEIGWQLPGHKPKIVNELTKVLKSEVKLSQQTLHRHPEAIANVFNTWSFLKTLPILCKIDCVLFSGLGTLPAYWVSLAWPSAFSISSSSLVFTYILSSSS